LFALFTSALLSFLVIIDPPGCAPIFASLTAGTSADHRRKMAIRSGAIAWAILVFFALGITLASFRLAGGIMLFIIALEMVFERRTQRREQRVHEMEAEGAEDISVFPMAIPMIAGPGSIATAMLLTSRAEGLAENAIVFGAMTLVILLTIVALLAAGPLMRLIGAKLEAMITRLLGVILAALAAQFVIDGIRQSFPGLT
jgi:multiple antibiotic resistance protein